MEQKNNIFIIVQYEGKILIERSKQLWKLPQTEVRPGISPEEAIGVFFQKKFSIVVETPELLDVYFNDDGVIIIYKVDLDQKHYLKLTSSKKDVFWWGGMYGDRQFNEKTRYIIDFLLKRKRLNFSILQQQEEIIPQQKYVIYTDGGSRGNPGHSAIGYVIYDDNETVVEQCGQYIGISVSAVAEYRAVLRALEVANELGIKKIELRVDNLMIVKQINGEYSIKNRELWPIHERILKIITKFDEFHVAHVKREFNEVADQLVNDTLDNHLLNS